MSEILKKYKEKTEYLQQLTEAYQSLVSAMLSHLKTQVSDETISKTIENLSTRIKGATNIFQVQQISNDYVKLTKQVDAHLKEKGAVKGGGLFAGLGSLFGGKGSGEKTSTEISKPDSPALPEARKAGSGIDLIDSEKESLEPYISLLDEFSKGTLLLSDDTEPFYADLRAQRAKRFENLLQKNVEDLRRSLYTFFINKSNEAGAVEHEREELKGIIGSLTGYIQSLSISSESFDTKLDVYSKQVTAAVNLDEIKKIKHAILAETLEIQKANTAVREKWIDINKRLREADEKILKLEQELQMAKEEKWVDALTQTYNRGYFDQRLSEAVRQFERNKEPCCLIMLDVDKFKQFNDSYGHPAGDKVLRVVAGLIKEIVRAGDTVARYGGEEFGIILYKSNMESSFTVAENIRENIARHEFGVRGETIYTSVSLGIAEFAEGDDSESIIYRADKALYKAKDEGRNCTMQG